MSGDDTGTSNVFMLDELRHMLDKGGEGNGAGNGGGGGGGDDPLRGQPIDARTLIDALKQMAGFTRTMVMSAMTKQADVTSEAAEFLTGAIIKGREADQGRMLEIAKQQHGTALEAMQATTLLARGVADRFEAAEKRISALERELALLKSANVGAGEDAGSGP